MPTSCLDMTQYTFPDQSYPPFLSDELPFEPRNVKVRTDASFEDEYEIKEELGK